jgi:hypothetical protein
MWPALARQLWEQKFRLSGSSPHRLERRRFFDLAGSGTAKIPFFVF